jgi:hypothetical protein
VADGGSAARDHTWWDLESGSKRGAAWSQVVVDR